MPRSPSTVTATLSICAKAPDISSSKKIGAFKLMKVAGAYWKGDADNEQLQRLYGTAFFDKKDLKDYLHMLEEAEKRDHRKLGVELGIYMMDEEAGVGLPLHQPAGARIIRILQESLRKELYRRGYEEVITPHIYKADVWKTSGHYGYYHDNMYFFEINEGSDEEPRLSEIRREADELSRWCHSYKMTFTLPRASRALLRVRHRLSSRDERRRARSHACWRIHAG